MKIKPRNKMLNDVLVSKRGGRHGKSNKALRKQANDQLKKGG